MNNKKYNQHKIVDILNNLISYNTTTGNNQEIKSCLEYIASLIPSDEYDIKIITNKEIPNLYAKSKRGSNPILLNGHIDVVPANQSQFKAVVKDNKLTGRGALDMKGAIAVMIVVLQNMKGYDLLITGDEEAGGKAGMEYLLKSGKIKEYAFAISGEPTGLSVATEEKGVMWLTALLKGKSSHAAKPWEGINPLFKLDKILSYLESNYGYPAEVWKTTVTPTLIKSSNGQNQIAESIEIGLDARYIPGDNPQKIVKKIKTLVDHVRVIHLDPPLYERSSMYTDKLAELSHKPITKMHWATDARYFENIPAVIYGPQGEGMHSSNEYVNLDSLDVMYKTLSHLAQNLG